MGRRHGPRGGPVATPIVGKGHTQGPPRALQNVTSTPLAPNATNVPNDTNVRTYQLPQTTREAAETLIAASKTIAASKIKTATYDKWWPWWRENMFYAHSHRDRNDVMEALQVVWVAAEEKWTMRRAAESALGWKEVALALLGDALGGNPDQINDSELRK
mmetsp:Transcript_12550/g.25041  ORF Transcript_12550/g.25041 Transcript_12550/m.25041 type:complete len:160 (-) Transcript_12550:57-536(-)